MTDSGPPTSQLTSRPSRVLVTGASGGTGRAILATLAPTDVTVRALTRSAGSRESLLDAGADEVVVGDLLDAADVRRALVACDAILFAAGSHIATALVPWRRVVDGDGLETILDVADPETIERIVFVSAIGVGDSRAGMAWWARSALLRWSIQAKARAETALRESGLEYVVLRPGWLTDEPPTDDLLVTEGGRTLGGSLPRADLATMAVRALVTPAAANRTVEIVTRESASGFDSAASSSIDWIEPTQPGERAVQGSPKTP